MRKPVFQEGMQYNIRSIINDDEIIQTLKQYNFDIIDVTSLSFIEQIELFSAAEVVVSPVGASMTNMIFAPKDTRLISLAPYYENADYSYWVKMMSALGIRIQFVLGHQINRINDHPMHRDYAVAPGLLKRVIEETLKNSI